VIRSFQVPNASFAIAGVACVLAAAPARAAAVLAASAIATAMRTDDMAEMGDAWARMRVSASALLLAGAVLALSPLGALAFGISSRSGVGIALGEAVLLVSIGALRVFLATATGPLRRRRAFEPDRVREAARPSLGWPFFLAIGGALLLGASLIRSWLDFLDGSKHPEPTAGVFVLWLAVALIGFAAVSIAYVRDKDGALRASELSGAWLRRVSYAASRSFDRFVSEPVTSIAVRIGERWIPAGDGGVVSAVGATGRLVVAGARLPVVPVAIAIAVILTVVVGLVSPGLLR
jgi:NADH:ubiquinone oxidoreductase subunit 5 (subunit L)/multisubunit Na+/H+ antiporter MnhA subunit